MSNLGANEVVVSLTNPQTASMHKFCIPNETMFYQTQREIPNLVLCLFEGKRRSKSDESDSNDENLPKKDLSLQQAVDQITTSFGKGSVMWLGRSLSPKQVPMVSTGSFSLDIALGIGGLPKEGEPVFEKSVQLLVRFGVWGLFRPFGNCVIAIANSIESSMITDLHKYESSQIHNPYIDHTLPINSQSFYSSGYSGHTALVESLLNPVLESRSSWQFNKEFDGFSDLDTYIQRKSHHQRISLDSI
ncbi:hypothetical protein TEA_013572 [Camellia sinensis var. sinensis]|uniref:RecA-like N-terminal domain-containing protein n=1 Tax=Camellia sinensis var. sinensis TaxID=542762 RepID=A0A4V3WJ54_CAMSN|nr:hypothetical protein TEA_013572 [Camellia sinensis var. sinensis]